jgi:hypothetical protein
MSLETGIMKVYTYNNIDGAWPLKHYMLNNTFCAAGGTVSCMAHISVAQTSVKTLHMWENVWHSILIKFYAFTAWWYISIIHESCNPVMNVLSIKHGEPNSVQGCSHVRNKQVSMLFVQHYVSNKWHYVCTICGPFHSVMCICLT